MLLIAFWTITFNVVLCKPPKEGRSENQVVYVEPTSNRPNSIAMPTNDPFEDRLRCARDELEANFYGCCTLSVTTAIFVIMSGLQIIKGNQCSQQSFPNDRFSDEEHCLGIHSMSAFLTGSAATFGCSILLCGCPQILSSAYTYGKLKIESILHEKAE